MLQHLTPVAVVLLLWIVIAVLARAWLDRPSDQINDEVRSGMTRLAARQAATKAADEVNGRMPRPRRSLFRSVDRYRRGIYRVR